MAASTSTAANPNNRAYDVFISHRGPEVKKTFASHLYRRLLSFGLRVFLDQPELERGDFIISQIESAIETASVQVAIFSPEYADSKWCLNELVSMLETDATVIPVFYKVEPTELRRTRGNAGIYAEALRRLEKKTSYEPQPEGEKSRHDSITIEKWSSALSRVAEKSGFELKACNE